MGKFKEFLSGVAGGLPVIGGVIQGAMDMRSQKKANEANMKLAEYSYGKDLEQWNRANAYNEPSAQMKRLEQAGLNPKLVYGSGGATTQAVQSPKYQTAEVRPVPMNFTAGVPNAITQFQDMQLKQQQLDNMRSQQRAINELVQQRAWENYFRELTHDSRVTHQNSYPTLQREIAQLTKNKISNEVTFNALTAQDRADLIKRALSIKNLQHAGLRQEFDFRRSTLPYQRQILQNKAREGGLKNLQTLQALDRGKVDLERGKIKLGFDRATIGDDAYRAAYKNRLISDSEIKKLEAEWFVATKLSQIGANIVGAATDIYPGTKVGKAAGKAAAEAAKAAKNKNPRSGMDNREQSYEEFLEYLYNKNKPNK